MLDDYNFFITIPKSFLSNTGKVSNIKQLSIFTNFTACLSINLPKILTSELTQEDFLNPGRKALDNSESDPLDPLRKTA